jgi:Xaa-Pro aminopeptidase
MREAHLRDGAAVVEFLCWLDQTAPKGGLTEIDVVTALEGYRRATNVLHDISFDTICGAGPNGAIMHYRVTKSTNRAVRMDELLLVDSAARNMRMGRPTSPAPSPWAIRGRRRGIAIPACCRG